MSDINTLVFENLGKISEQDNSDNEYREYFQSKLAKWNINSPDELSDEDKKKFFDEVDAGWKAEKETD